MLIAGMAAAGWSAQARAASAGPRPVDGRPKLLLTGRSELSSYVIYTASPQTNWRWRPLAAIAPRGGSGDYWIGQQCLTGDGTHVIVVVGSRSASNAPAGMAHGGIAYSVSVSTGRVTPLAARVSLAYFNPGCGLGDSFALVSYPSQNESSSVVVWGTASRGITHAYAGLGEITSPVPVASGVLAVMGSSVVRIRNGHAPGLVARFQGQPYDLRVNARRGVDLVDSAGGHTTAWRVTPYGKVLLGEGKPNAAITAGYDGVDTLINIHPSGGSLRVVGEPGTTPSQAGRVASSLPRVAVSAHGLEGIRPATTIAGPACAVPPNVPNIEAPQPSGAQIDWGLQEAAKNGLSAANGRPAGAFNLGLPAYSASTDFRIPALKNGADSTVPPQVMEGIFATESAWHQASFHAPRGLPGDPFTASYYGTDTAGDTIDYGSADCGYGVGQVTYFMTAGSTAEPFSTKLKVAVDYEENIAASEQILARDWNQLASMGVTLNNRKPSVLENWYFSLWAYNSAIHPKDSYGNYGLGWSNNPINPIYVPNRPEFLSKCLCDASHPNDWPYQERVFGWMDTPYTEGSQAFYKSATRSGQHLTIPKESLFCGSSDSCNPKDPQKQYCLRSDFHCWWHLHATDAKCKVAGRCHNEFFTIKLGTREPVVTNPAPPVCAPSPAFPAGSAIVDDEATDINLAGCPDPGQWESSGSFTVRFGTNAAGQPAGAIDWHQLGAGFGGHLWFTHSVGLSDPGATDTATWTPILPASGQYDLKVFVPSIGATDTEAQYRVFGSRSESGATAVTVNQNNYSNQWVDMGVFALKPGAHVELSNNDADVASDIAFDAMAFAPSGAGPSHSQ
jgi:hypothetical protein